MIILGINYFFHDSSACLLRDGELLVTLEEERLTRQKHTSAFPTKAVERCLKIAGVKPAEVNHIAVSIAPTLHWQKKCVHGFKHLKDIAPFIKHEVLGTFFKQKGLRQW